LHAVYTLLDLRSPRRLLDGDPSVAHAMANSALRLSGGRTDRVDASCSNQRCIAPRHAYLRRRVEQPGKYRKIADRVHGMKVGQHFDVRGVGTDE